MSVRAFAWAWKQACPSPVAKLVLVRLAFSASEDNKAWPSQRLIAEDCGVSRETVSRAIRALLAAGLLRSQRRANGDGGTATNLYTVPCDAGSHPSAAEPHPCDRLGDAGSQGGVTNDHTESLVGKVNGIDPPIVPPRGPGLKVEFARWWLAYPHKVGKGDAEKKFAIARRAASLAELLDGITRYKRIKPAEHSWCNPATWLHQRRWEDEADLPLMNGRGGQTGPPPPPLNPKMLGHSLPCSCPNCTRWVALTREEHSHA